MTRGPKLPQTAIPTFAFTPIARPELYDRLDAALATSHGQAVLISAPAGSGKTVLIADWLGNHLRPAHPEREVRWLTVTRRNGGAAALRAVLQRAAADHPAVLVIDNAHLITEPPALAYLEYLLAHLPSTTTAVISARFAPPLRWHAVELPGLVSLLGTTDLAFDSVHVQQLCEEHDCLLTDAELGTVMELTRGWPTLARIAAGQIGAHRDRRTALATLAATPRAVADFLLGEFVDELPEQIRRFVVDTSIPTTFTAALAEQLTGLDAHQILDGLLRTNFPLTHTAQSGELWFSYHPMLRTHLRAEARCGADYLELHRRTADWYSAIDLPMSALPHVLAGTPADVLRFLRDTAMRVVLDGAGADLFEQLEHAAVLPVDDPYLWVLRAIDALERHDVSTAVAHLDVVCQRTPVIQTIAPRGWIVPLTLAATAAAAVASGTGLAEIVLPEPLPITGQPDIDSYVAIEAAAIPVARGDLAGGRQLLRRGLALAKCVGNHRMVVRSTARLAVVAGIRGSVTVASDTAERAARIAGAHHHGSSADAVAAASVSSYVGYLRGKNVSGSAESAQQPCTLLVTQLHAFGAAADKYAAAESLRTNMLRLLQYTRALPAVAGLLLPEVVRALLEVDDAHTVRALIDRAGAMLGESVGVTLARATTAMSASHPKTVLGLVEPVLAQADATHPVQLITALLLAASAQAALANPLAAKAAVESALRAACPEHIVRPFLDITGVIALLDAHAGTFGRHNGFADEIRHHPAVRREDTRSRLTATERLVLDQLPSGQTAQQIADGLGVSINTVKTHLRGIYTKLGTTSRAETLILARRTGLL